MKPNAETPHILKRLFEPVIHLLVAVEQTIARLIRRTEKSGTPIPIRVAVEPELSKRAFALWAKAGHPEGREWEFWDLAEIEFAAESRPPCHRPHFRHLSPRNPPSGRSGLSGIRNPERSRNR